jgi:hypothetical protein
MATDAVSLAQLDFDEEAAKGVEVIDEEDEIDVSSLARMSEDAPVVRLVNVLLVDACNAERPTSTSSLTKKRCASAFASTACSTM